MNWYLLASLIANIILAFAALYSIRSNSKIASRQIRAEYVFSKKYEELTELKEIIVNSLSTISTGAFDIRMFKHDLITRVEIEKRMRDGYRKLNIYTQCYDIIVTHKKNPTLDKINSKFETLLSIFMNVDFNNPDYEQLSKLSFDISADFTEYYNQVKTELEESI